MKSDEYSIHEIWEIARQVTELAYVHERKGEVDSTEDNIHIKEVFAQIKTALLSRQKRVEKSQHSIFDIFAVNRLAQVYRNFKTGSIGEVDAKMEIWKILTSPDDPDYENQELALGLALPTVSEIAACGGPKETAIQQWTDIRSGSHRSIYGNESKMAKGKLKFSLQGVFLPHVERMQYIAVICARLLRLKNDELGVLAQEFKQISDEDESN